MERGKSPGKTVLIIILLIGLLLSLTYIGYNKLYITTPKEKENLPKENTSSEEKQENLSLDNRLVQNLYNEVGMNSKYTPYWMYEIEGMSQAKIDIKNMPEVNKMELVYVNIKESDMDMISCFQVPNQTDPNLGNCYSQGKNMISKDVVERIYKTLYGSQANLDLNTIMFTDKYGVGRYKYVQSLDAYILFAIEAGGSSAVETTKELTKAEKIGKQIKLYETVTTTSMDNSKVTTAENYIYTFEQEEDGIYTYISREKA